MIVAQRRRRGLPYRVVWFCPHPVFRLWPPTVFRQSPALGNFPGLVRQEFHTYLSSLEGPPEAWLGAMNSTTRNEIKQASRLEVEGFSASLDSFVSFFNAFAQEKQIEGTNPGKLVPFGTALRLYGVRLSGRVLAMHALIADPQAGRGRLLLSASARFLDSADRSVVGKANRWLHWWEMGQLAQEGLKVYDWGGFAKGSEDAGKQGINRFKEAFGGIAVEESHYLPFYLSGFQD